MACACLGLDIDQGSWPPPPHNQQKLTRVQTRNSGKALFGPLQPQEGAKQVTLVCSPRGRRAGSLYGSHMENVIYAILNSQDIVKALLSRARKKLISFVLPRGAKSI